MGWSSVLARGSDQQFNHLAVVDSVLIGGHSCSVYGTHFLDLRSCLFVHHHVLGLLLRISDQTKKKAKRSSSGLCAMTVRI